MSWSTDYRHQMACDRCHKKVTVHTDEEDPPFPNGWAEIALRTCEEGRWSRTRGNENAFTNLCPKCLQELNIDWR